MAGKCQNCDSHSESQLQRCYAASINKCILLVVVLVMKQTCKLVFPLKSASRSECFLEAASEMNLKHVGPAQEACA